MLLHILQDGFLQTQLFQGLAVPLKEFHGVPALLLLRHMGDGMLLDMGQGVLHRPGKAVEGQGPAAFRCLNGRLRRFLDAHALQGGNLHHPAAQLFPQLSGVQLVAPLFHSIHHIDGHHHGDAQLRQLGGEIQVPLQIGAVNDVQDSVRTLINEIIPGHHFFQCIG